MTTVTDTINKQYVEMKQREARSKIDSAIENDNLEKARYWLGHRRALDNVLREMEDE